MDAELTKSFPLSASYSLDGRSIGRNFTLHVTVDALDEARERELERIVERELLSKVH